MPETDNISESGDLQDAFSQKNIETDDAGAMKEEFVVGGALLADDTIAMETY